MWYSKKVSSPSAGAAAQLYTLTAYMPDIGPIVHNKK